MTDIQSWLDRGQFAELRGHRIFYLDENQDAAETIILVHGFPTSSWDWHAIWDGLAKDYRVCALDMLGFGYSDKPRRHKYSIHEQADFVTDFIDHLGIGRAHILAHDYGDTVIQEVLARYNERQLGFNIQSVCLLNGGLFPETHQALLIQKLLLSPIGPLINALTRKKQFDRSFSRVFGPDTKPGRDELQSFWNLINHNGGRHIFHNLITYMTDRKNNRQRWIDAIADFSGPVALINGSADPVSGAHMTDRYKELLGDPAYFKALPGIGHYPQVEAPDVVLAGYREFLNMQSS